MRKNYYLFCILLWFAPISVTPMAEGTIIAKEIFNLSNVKGIAINKFRHEIVTHKGVLFIIENGGDVIAIDEKKQEIIYRKRIDKYEDVKLLVSGDTGVVITLRHEKAPPNKRKGRDRILLMNTISGDTIAEMKGIKIITAGMRERYLYLIKDNHPEKSGDVFYLSKIDIDTGKVLWDIPIEYEDKILVGDKLFLIGLEKIKAQSINDGSILWEKQLSGDSEYIRMFALLSERNEICVVTTLSNIYAFSTESGDKRCVYHMNAKRRNAFSVCQPVLVGRNIVAIDSLSSKEETRVRVDLCFIDVNGYRPIQRKSMYGYYDNLCRAFNDKVLFGASWDGTEDGGRIYACKSGDISDAREVDLKGDGLESNLYKENGYSIRYISQRGRYMMLVDKP